MNTLSIILISVYTFVYIIVFIIQRAHIVNLKEVTAQMKSYMEIFDVKKFKEYVELKEENMKMRYDLLINNEPKLQEIAEMVIKNHIGELEKDYESAMINQIGIDLEELIECAYRVLILAPDEKTRQRMFEETFPNARRFLEPMVKEGLDMEAKALNVKSRNKRKNPMS